MTSLAVALAPAAPAVGIAAILGLTLITLLTFMMLLGLRKTVADWLGALVGLLQRTTVFGVHIFGWLARGLLAAESYVEDRLGQAATAAAAPVARFLNSLAAVLEYGAFATAHLAEATLDALDKLRRAVIPNVVHGLTVPIRATAHGAHTLAQWLVRHVATVEHNLARDFRLAERHAAAAYAGAIAALAHAFGVALPRTLGWTEREVGRLEGEISSRLTRRMRAIAAGALAVVSAGLVVRALVRYLPWYRCTNVNNLARGVCRMDKGYLDALLLGLLAVPGIFGLVAFTKEVQGIVGGFEEGLKFTISELRHLENRDEHNREAFLTLYNAPPG